MTAPRVDVYRANPVARLLAALLIGVILIFSIDWVSALTALVLETVLLLLSGIPIGKVLRRSLPVVIAGLLTALTILLYGQPSGTVHAQFLLVTISDGSIALAAATLLRVLAIGLPSILLFLDIDPTDLADGLAQILRLPARFVLGALAGFRLIGLLQQDWRYLGYARRARGVADHGRIRRSAGQAFALLVFAVRRGAKLATAMEARGFGAHPTRTWARESALSKSDIAIVAIGAAIGATSIAVAVLAGTWSFIGAR
ncbi:energy-coupling factor transporter transmembrane component T family protein [Microbacterium azadirachtae]|uniref:Energy-coupling factor transport system permease protein n=1 Tax=Microbacterium azadirachtae TaxID=582680 RepID=A0A1I6G8W4_9MICO|nr:energy-coupling factor transporter transmembrane component T [Microbacterium azadirachtae]SDL37566.1 energy-coupling factor transport system permease protein [Microbacterium azadirachtae]SEF68494.1 energy-coupling factor transport system permease protein [Microbacterium azadirachtae]SEF69185.1 energy-coupling factor transport system permease protein [Microbacterium azadirachtae]SFR38507.1 energy-coupling factor transport system permease protein [Microbacterium azadirachtae]